MSTSRNGMSAQCASCAITIVSVGRLLQDSDRAQVGSLWGYIAEARDFEPAHRPCPKCEKPLIRFDLKIDTQPHRIVACKHCYTCVLRNSTHQAFLDANPKVQEQRLLQSHQQRIAAQNKDFDQIDRAMGSLMRDLYSSFRKFQDALPQHFQVFAKVLGFCALVRFFGVTISLGIVFGFLIAERIFQNWERQAAQTESKPVDVFVSQNSNSRSVALHSARSGAPARRAV